MEDRDAAPPMETITGPVIGQPAPPLEETLPSSSEPEQTTRLGRYLLLERIGQGGMGAVYAAYDPSLDRKVALKLILPERLKAPDAPIFFDRLMREAQAMAKLSHPNVITVHDVGMLGDKAFIAMEYVEGVTLGAWLSEKERSTREILGAFAQAGRGLAAAHAAGLVHRDFKPDNVLVDAGDRVRATDFGLSLLANPQPVRPLRPIRWPAARPASCWDNR